MKKILQISLIFCLISFSISVMASTPTTWEEIRDKIWQDDDTLTAQNFDIIVQKIAEFNGLNNFLGMFDLVVDKVKELDEKFAKFFNEESGNFGMGTETPSAKLEIVGDLALRGASIIRRKNLVNFVHPSTGYPVGQEWAERYYHIRTPDTNGSGDMYRYDLTGYSYALSRPLGFTWVGYLYLSLIQTYAKDTIGNGIGVSQYIGSDNHLYLKFGPISQYFNSFVLDYQSGSTGEAIIHKPEDYQVFLRSDPYNF